MKKVKNIFWLFIALFLIAQRVSATWEEEGKQENVFSISQKSLKKTGKDNRDLSSLSPRISVKKTRALLTLSNSTTYKENESWETISDFLAYGGIWKLSSSFYLFQLSNYSSRTHLLRTEIFNIQQINKDKKALKKKWENLKFSSTFLDSYKLSAFMLKKSFCTQLHDHQLGERMYAFSEINSIFHYPFVAFNEKDLTILDVDDTLTWFLDPYYSEHARKNSSLHQRFRSLEKNVQNRFFHWVLTSAPFALIESHVAQLISTLQEKELKVMALTALRPQIFPENSGLTNLPKWRIELLKKLKIDFSKNFSIPPLGWRFDKTSNQSFPEPYFEKGVLFSGLAGKPMALFNFLRAVQFKPKRVLFVDDSFLNVVSVYRALTRLDIKCYSVLYTRANKHSSDKPFSAEAFRTYLNEQEKFVEALLLNPQPLPDK